MLSKLVGLHLASLLRKHDSDVLQLTHVVRRGGTILNVGLLDPSHQTAHVSNIVKALTIKYTFGGKNIDIEQGLAKISKGTLSPRVETAPLKDFKQVLEDLHAGKIKSRMVLVPEGVAGVEKYQSML